MWETESWVSSTICSRIMGLMCSPVRFSHHLSLSNSLKWEGLNTMHNCCQRNFVCSSIRLERKQMADAGFARLNSLNVKPWRLFSSSASFKLQWRLLTNGVNVKGGTPLGNQKEMACPSLFEFRSPATRRVFVLSDFWNVDTQHTHLGTVAMKSNPHMHMAHGLSTSQLHKWSTGTVALTQHNWSTLALGHTRECRKVLRFLTTRSHVEGGTEPENI